MKTSFSLTVMATCLAFVGLAQAQNYAINWFTIDGGGGTSTGGVFAVSGTIGQPDAGTMSAGAYSLMGGFWGLLGSSQAPPPLLFIANNSGTIVVSWSRPADGFLLERTGALTSPPAAISWNTVPLGTYQTNSSSIFITVPMPTGNQFYRLRKP